MEDPFIVGGRYRNRLGEYEVIELDGPKMLIRYSDGRTLETDVELQARIWENIQAEGSATPPPTKTLPSTRLPSRADRRGYDFHGLEAHDFQRGAAATSWRARPKLGGQLARLMSDTTGSFFQSYAIFRRAEVHVARPERYIEKMRLQEAKFVFDLDAERARYGFYIEKNSGSMDDAWDWLRFLDALETNGLLQQTILIAMDQLQLHWGLIVEGEGALRVRVVVVEDGLRWEPEEQKESQVITWPTFVERLKALESDKWCDLYLCAHMDKEQAMAEGVGLGGSVTKVYRALLPLYEASTKAA